MWTLRSTLLAASFAAFTLAGPAPAGAGELTYSDVDMSDLIGLTMVGQNEEAIREAKRLADGLRPTDDPLNIRLIGQLLLVRCEAHNNLGQFKEAEGACLEAIAIFEEVENDRSSVSWLGAESHISRGLSALKTAYEATGNVKGALELRKKLLQRSLRGGRGGDPEKVRLLVETGNLQFSLGQYREAEEFFRMAIIGHTEIRRDDRPLLLPPHNNLALLYRLEERFVLAEAILQEGLADIEETQAVLTERHAKFGLHSSDIRLNNWSIQVLKQALGWVYYHQGRLKEARDTASGVLAYYKEEGDQGLGLQIDLWVLLARIEDADKPGSEQARRHLETAVIEPTANHDLKTAVVDPSEIYGLPYYFQAAALSELARHHLLSGDPAAAEPAARQAVETFGWVLGKDHYVAARANFVLARVLQQLGKYDEALTPANYAFAAQWTCLPRYHSEIGETLTLMAELYEALGKQKNLRGTRVLIEDHKAARAEFEIEN